MATCTTAERDLQETADRIVRQEVRLCVSGLVSIMAGAFDDCANKDLNAACEQAMELARPVDDWEEAARQAGWAPFEGGWRRAATYAECTHDGVDDFIFATDAADACDHDKLDPYEWEVYEHWAVSHWLADKLEAHGEKVDRDFAGLTVWARTCTGQAISMDSVLQTIAREISQ